MLNRKTSAKVSLGICIFFLVALLALSATFPMFFHWIYVSYHGLSETNAITVRNVRNVTIAFYLCVPFAGAALYALIRLMLGILKDRVFEHKNVFYLRLISWCCLAVFLITGGFGFLYVPLFIVSLAMAVVGVLVRVVMNVMRSAVELREENDLTI